MNLIPRPPTNDFQASAVSPPETSELRADARMSGRSNATEGDGVGRVRTRRGTVSSATSSIRTIRLAAMTAPPRGVNCAWCSIAGQTCCCRATSTTSVNPLTYNKVLAAKPGYPIRQPARFPRRSNVITLRGDTLHYGASARLTMA